MNHEEQGEALALAKDLLDDIELSRTPLDRQILKASRLARMLGDEEVAHWLGQEKGGYYANSEKTDEYFKLTGRHGKTAGENIYSGANQLEGSIRTFKLQLAQLTVPNVSGDMALLATRAVTDTIIGYGKLVERYTRITTKVEALLHNFVAKSYLSLKFSTKQDSMFEKAKKEIDTELLRLDESTLRKIDSAYSSLRVGDAESISAAMNSVRRLIVSFADLVFPATDETRPNPGDGKPMRLGSEQWLNRIKAFIVDNAQSSGRQTRLRQGIQGISDRVSTGVHNEVSKSEAEFLYISAYILLGEMLSLRTNNDEELVTATVGEA
ncbi:hypothetical protein D6T63_12185 [Arthrobacter cheniae]|uniref:AbiTii domain-containing protein n=1 Tax=Arthrobacter cheniae TaxID=1258888 RepID=A0A3A5LZM6_9MICC|nr:hypothetical protein [Arthrobacter cheniae]RJT78283.1 hypothetical protein D6T63_12185 [Arthrobacter cheniae]